ncbi:hypothetical protein FN846DRAFT_71467 [Sphaerosporella brunnea]|uniref:Plus3 domain-containing protein n=1 Tax=Sphaerosporella brunnea TaxID=1250544 RepID=A0A5J5ETE4_9PEZI|nr:hypothetical protein FN846DRAFT_71467 [Sphaerosporella brunnea]
MASLDEELLALVGDSSDEYSHDDDNDVKSAASPPPQQSPAATAPAAAAAPSSPKKRTRAAPAKRSRKKQRRDSTEDEDDDDEEEEGLVKDEDDMPSEEESFAASSDAGRDVAMDLGTDSGSDGEGQAILYPLEGKYKDHEDKQRLLAMTEIDREAVLADRAAQIERDKLDRQLRNWLKSKKEDRAGAAASSTRKSLRTKSAPKKTQEASKRGALDQLARTRAERKATGGRRSSFGEEDASKKLLSEGEEDENDEHIPKRQDDRPITLDDVNRCRIGRTALAKYFDYPGFEDAIPDVFVRVTLWDKDSGKSVYRMAQIKGLQQGKMYNMLDGVRKTDMHLRVVHGKSERDFPMDMMSDSKFTEAEFNRYKSQLDIEKVPLTTRKQLLAKEAALRELTTRSLSESELNAIITRRNANKNNLLNHAQQRHKLRTARDAAFAADDLEEVARLDAELQELEDQASGPARAETQMQRMARLNAENRKRNLAEIRKAEIAEKRAAREALLKAESQGGSFANPFMRVKTTVKFKHNMEAEKKHIVAAELTPPPTVPEKDRGPGVMNALAGAGPPKGRRAGGVDDVIASMDLGIEIDL